MDFKAKGAREYGQVTNWNSMLMVMREGIATWNMFNKHIADGHEALVKAIAGHLPDSEGFVQADRNKAMAAMMWCHAGFPLIDVTSHTYAAALAATEGAPLDAPINLRSHRLRPTKDST